MPLVKFEESFKQESPFDYPRLSLDRNERARILLIEETPLLEYVHTLRAPQLNNGVLVTEMAKDRDGQEREVPKYDFLARFICLGDESTITDKGSDPDACPMCRAAGESTAVWKPERRFGMHVIRYAIKPGTFDLAEPFGVSLIAWTFANKTFNAIVELAKQWGDLRKHDLLLGPCSSKQYQKFDISIAPTAEWLASDSRKKTVKETYAANKAEDISLLIARRGNIEQIQEHLETVMSRTAQAFGKSASDKAIEETVTPEAIGLDKMEAEAKEDAEPDAAPKEETAATESLDDLLADI